MSYTITDITSIMLDRTKPFDMRIKLMVGDHVAESIPVTQTKANATFAMINKKWWEAIEKLNK